MFWYSVTTGLAVLTYWQTYAAAALFVAICLIPVFLVSFLERFPGAMMVAGCLASLVMPFFSLFALVVFVFTLSPIILGLATEAAWGWPWAIALNNPGLMAKSVGVLLLSSLALALMPLIGRFHFIHSFFTLLLGCLVLVASLGIMGASVSTIGEKSIHFWPGLWFIFGVMTLGYILSRVSSFLAVILATFIDQEFKGKGWLVALPIAEVGGFVPIFVYGAWLGAQLRAGG